jgi:protein O-mannosyl-transferase
LSSFSQISCSSSLFFISYSFPFLSRRAILGNPDVMDVTQPWYQLLYNDFWGTPLVDSGSHGSYRPFCVLSYKLNFILGGFKPFGYHLVNVLLHTLSTGLVVKLARHILPNGIGILIAGLLFASHPVHTEAVAGIVGRADLLACIFYVSTLLSYIRHVQWREKCDSRHWLTLCEAILYSSVAILCKETAISSLVVCIVYDILKGFNTFTRDKVKSLNFH